MLRIVGFFQNVVKNLTLSAAFLNRSARYRKYGFETITETVSKLKKSTLLESNEQQRNGTN